jgi:glycosyltransferase involved in cell wall biosynthesis
VPQTRVLHVVEAIEAGVARHVADVVLYAKDVEHHVAAPPIRVGWTTDDAAKAAARAAGAEIHDVDMRRRPADRHNAAAVIQLRRLIRRLRPDVVHGHSSVGGALGRIAATGTGAWRIYTPNGLRPSRPLLTVERGLGRMTDTFIAVSEGERAAAVAARLAPSDAIEVVPNGIDLRVPPPHSLDVRARLGLAPDARLVMSIGRLVPQKAPEQLVRTAAAARDDTHFVLVGAGPLAAVVAEEVRGTGLGSRFHALGAIPDAARLLPQADVFVLTSRFEGCPYTPLEAMRAGIPVILTDVVGNRDVVKPEASGLLVPFGDPQAMAAAIARVLGDDETRARLTQGGRHQLTRDHDVAAMGHTLSALYRKVATARS